MLKIEDMDVIVSVIRNIDIDFFETIKDVADIGDNGELHLWSARVLPSRVILVWDEVVVP